MAGWHNPPGQNPAMKSRKFDRNLIVIGAGSAGLVSSYIAAIAKAKVSLIEAHEMGGDCLNTGCVPSKALLQSARVAKAARDGARYGVQVGQVRIDFPTVMQRLRQVITDIEPHDSVERFTGLGVDCIKGYARFVDQWTVEIDAADGSKSRLTSKAFVIATGAAPIVPPLPGIEDSGYLTSETLWDAMAQRAEVPKRLTILGGGPIGCELAQAFQRLGSQVTIVEMADRLMLKEDADAAALVEAALRKEGIDVRTGHKALRFDGRGRLVLGGLNFESSLDYDDIIIAIGRRARVTGFGLEELGLVKDGSLVVDEYLATRLPHIKVAGDVAGNQQLTHGASHEAWYATVNALARPFKRYKADYRVLPRVTYTDPEVATVGLTEAEAQAQGIAYEITRYDLDDLDRAIADGEAHGFVKILTVPSKDRILGATIVATHAGEMIAELVLAMKHNMGLRKIMQAVHSYPTWAEANKYAAGQWGLARQPERLQRLAKWWFNWQRG
jgi:pyruvate/2-oxoglutarate dehydrogenase complex dihydrolipoamide dehydrogenase (E3) component